MNYARQYPRFWLGYFVLSVLLFVGGVVATVADIQSSGPSDLIGLAYGLIGLWPLYGYVRQRRYNPRWLWLVTLGISLVATALAVLLCLYTGVATGQAALPIAIALAVAALSGPYVFALHQYLFRSAHIWQ